MRIDTVLQQKMINRFLSCLNEALNANNPAEEQQELNTALMWAEMIKVAEGTIVGDYVYPNVNPTPGEVYIPPLPSMSPLPTA